jgi:adenylate cyclase, class 2
MSTQGGKETEVKIPLPDDAAIGSVTERIRRLGLAVSVPCVFEANVLYDTSDQRLRRDQMLLRLRQAGDKCVLTWKGRGVPGPHKTRPELETTVGSFEVLHQILQNIGFQPAFRYEKYRTEFADSRAPAAGTVTLDETPIGNFLELEGAGDWIDEVAQRLGFTKQDYLLDSYAKLYLDYCFRNGLQPTHMLFASHR